MTFTSLLATAGACAISMAALNWLGGSKWRAARHEPWAERARLLYPVRIAAQLNFLLLTGAACLFALGGWNSGASWYWFGAAGFLGATLGSYPLGRVTMPELTFRAWLGQLAIAWGARAVVYAPLLGAIAVAPPSWNGRMAAIAIGFALWHFWSSSGGVVDLWRWIGLMKPVPENVMSVLLPSFSRLGITPRHTLVFTSPLLLAFAVPLRKTLIFTQGLLARCDPDELNAVCLHELAHLSEDWRILAQRIITSFAVYPLIFLSPAVATWGPAGFLPIYVLFLALFFFARRVGRNAEVRADEVAAEHQADEGLYARALLKIYSLNQFPAVMPGKRQLHPHLYDRMVAAGVSPDFPRPAAPANLNWTVLIPIAALIALALRL